MTEARRRVLDALDEFRARFDERDREARDAIEVATDRLEGAERLERARQAKRAVKPQLPPGTGDRSR